jgi:hypothetical protein
MVRTAALRPDLLKLQGFPLNGIVTRKRILPRTSEYCLVTQNVPLFSEKKKIPAGNAKGIGKSASSWGGEKALKNPLLPGVGGSCLKSSLLRGQRSGGSRFETSLGK